MCLLHLPSGHSGAIPAADLGVRGLQPWQLSWLSDTPRNPYKLNVPMSSPPSHCLVHMDTDIHLHRPRPPSIIQFPSPLHHPHVWRWSTFLQSPCRPSGFFLCLFAGTLNSEVAHPGRVGAGYMLKRHGWLTTWKASGIIKTMALLYGTFVGFLAGLLESRENPSSPICWQVSLNKSLRATRSGAVVL